MMESWNGGDGKKEWWKRREGIIGILESWNGGILERNNGILEEKGRKLGSMEGWNGVPLLSIIPFLLSLQ